METRRIAFRCPNCGTEGKARAEVLGRRVACKQCTHVFRAQAIVDLSGVASDSTETAPVTTRPSSSRLRIETLEAEVATLRAENRAIAADRDEAMTAAREEAVRFAETIASLQERARVADRLESEIGWDQAPTEALAPGQAATVMDLAIGPLRDLANLRDERDQLQNELAERTRERDEALAAARECEADLARRIADHEAAQNDLRAVIEQARRDEAEAVRIAVRESEAAWSRDHRSLEAEIEQFHRQRRDEHEQFQVEARIAARELAEARAAIRELEQQGEALRAHLEVALAERTAERDRAQAEIEALGRRLAQAEDQLAEIRRVDDHDREVLRAEVERLTALVAASATSQESPPPPPSPPSPPETPPPPPESVEPEDRSNSAWADFERRLSETQARLRAANARADLVEDEARRTLAELTELRRQVESGLSGDSIEFAASLSSMAIMANRGAPNLTWPEAEARLNLARQLAAERKDRHLIDRINRTTETVRSDLESYHTTLAESLIRGMEIEAGIDPGGWSIGGLRIFHPRPAVIRNREALDFALDRVLRQGDRAATQAMVGEILAILGDQAGLPDLRRPGRRPATRRPITEGQAARLFLDALSGENWLVRPIEAQRTPPETALATYATLTEGCAEARDSVARLVPDRLEWLDRVLRASAAMILRRQLPDGHLPFLDPRGKSSKTATAIETLVARQPGAVRDGWVVAVDPAGIAQAETGLCAAALIRAGAAAGMSEWTEGAFRAATWLAGQPNLANVLANAHAVRALALVHRARPDDRLREGLVRRLDLGLLPWQAASGRWLDAAMAQTPQHLWLHLALLDAAETLADAPEAELRQALDAAIDRSLASLLEETAALGVSSHGEVARVLIRERDRAARSGRPLDARADSALLDAITVIQETCHEGGRVRLGVPADVLATLIHA